MTDQEALIYFGLMSIILLPALFQVHAAIARVQGGRWITYLALPYYALMGAGCWGVLLIAEILR